MKKLILTTALCGFSTAASAGPLLDQLLDGVSASSSSELVLLNTETYTDLVINVDRSSDVRIASLNLKSEDDKIHVTGTGFEVFERGKSVVMASGIDMTIDKEFLSHDLEQFFSSKQSLDNEVCTSIDLPMSLAVRDMEISEKEDSVLSIDEINVEYDIIDPEHDCVLDLSVTVNGVAGSESSDLPFIYKIDDVNLAVFSGLLLDKAPRQTSKPYIQDMSILGVSVSLGGAEQVRLDRLMSSSRLNPDSLKLLSESIYGHLIDDVITSNGQNVPDISREDIRALWDGVRALESSGDVTLEGLKIVGGLASTMTGEDILAAGRQLDMMMFFDKNGEDMEYVFDFNLSDVVETGLQIDMVMKEFPAGLEKMPMNAMLTSLPIYLSGLEFEFVDHSLSDRIQRQIGMDMYEFAAMNLTGLFGYEKASAVKDWLMTAKTGGAYFSASPMSPLAPIQIVTGVMGDWESFGETINAKTSK